jgi:hypothetical protein
LVTSLSIDWTLAFSIPFLDSASFSFVSFLLSEKLLFVGLKFLIVGSSCFDSSYHFFIQFSAFATVNGFLSSAFFLRPVYFAFDAIFQQIFLLMLLVYVFLFAIFYMPISDGYYGLESWVFPFVLGLTSL